MEKDPPLYYWQMINWYRWEFLRRSTEYKQFYKRVKTELLTPLKQLLSEIKKRGLKWNAVRAGIGPKDIVDLKKELLKKYAAFDKEAQESFGLNWYLADKYYSLSDMREPANFLNPKKSLKRRDDIIFSDYQKYSAYYPDFRFQPALVQITEYPTARNFETMKNQGFIFIALNTWGNPLTEKDWITYREKVESALQFSTRAPEATNPFLLDPSKPIEIPTLGLQAQELEKHFQESLEGVDLFDRLMKKDTKKTTVRSDIASRLGLSEGAVRKRIKNGEKYISEAAHGRFYQPKTA
jgi:hypothetical protein